MSDDGSVSVDFALLCDDIRREDTGKNIFIGVYLGGVDLHANPFRGVFQLAAFIERKDPSLTHIQVISKFDGEQISRTDLEVSDEAGKKIFLPVPVVVDGITKSGVFEAFIQVEKEEPVLALDKPFTMRAEAAPEP